MSLLSLPRSYIAGIIYHFCDEESLLRMREVCKNTKEIVGDLILTEPTYVNFSDVCETVDQICIELRLEDFEKFLKSFAAFIRKAAFNNIQFNTIKCISIYSDFLEGRPVHSIDFNLQQLEVSDLDKCLELVKKSTPREVTLCYVPLTHESLKYLIEIAKLVEGLLILPRKNSSTLLKLPLSVTQAILSAKCKTLTLRQIVYSIEEVEKLIQFFHHLDKKVQLFQVDVEDARMNVRIGEYLVQINGDADHTRTFWIEHKEF